MTEQVGVIITVVLKDETEVEMEIQNPLGYGHREEALRWANAIKRTGLDRHMPDGTLRLYGPHEIAYVDVPPAEEDGGTNETVLS